MRDANCGSSYLSLLGVDDWYERRNNFIAEMQAMFHNFGSQQAVRTQIPALRFTSRADGKH